MIEQTFTNIKLQVENKEGQITSQLNATKPIINADRVHITNILFNLIDNALKYSKDNIKVILNNEKISVIDHGIGINPNEIENITKKFYRVSSNGWNNSLGVGLSLVVNILSAHNFKLEIESIENEGSTFNIIF